MNIIQDKTKLNDINAYLLIAFAFVLPVTVAGANILAGVIFIVWLLRGTFKSDWNELKLNTVVLSVLIFYALHIVGLLWTEDLQWGLHILKKETKFLLIPIFMLFVRKEHIKYYIYGFLVSMSISEILSYGVWFELLPEFKNATINNPTPFMSHITYNPFLAFAIYLLLNQVIFSNSLTYIQKYLYSFFAITMSINMFITGGRAGQVMYLAMLVILLFQYFNTKKLKAFIVSILVIPFIFQIAYNSSPIFKNRVDMAITNITHYEDNKNTSVGLRLTFAINSFDILKDNLIIGVGTGDFKIEYAKVNKINTPQVLYTTNPHNMYIMELVQFGLLGLLVLVSILVNQIRYALKSKDDSIKYMGLTLPLLYGLIMFSDTYLLGHYTSMLFIFFSAFLYNRNTLID